MGALTIAFDTIIVGALALPWLLLVIHLFFSDKESSIENLQGRVNKLNQPAVAGVLLFAMAYSLGSVVSRIAKDFFDDGDLHIQVFGRLFRVGVTETGIRTVVYCQNRELIAQTAGDSLTDKVKQFKANDSTCPYIGSWDVPQSYESRVEAQDAEKDLAGDIFHIQESTLLLKGTDANERLRQVHDQIMVLRGAAFDALIAFSLCLFGWSARGKSWLRCAVPFLFLLPGGIAFVNHVQERPMIDPPYMEFSLLTLAAASVYLLRKFWPKIGAQGKPGAQNGQGEIRLRYLVLAAFLTTTTFLGWWSTEVLYDQQVIYSYQAASVKP